ncbi:LysR family transcriptional regulator [Nakamurella lactea]|uniref:LysR family transcriptional regulator n=1 Tax=Nakamurella lactea TaxID=459515 RepID=UPI000A06907C|nr:LysR substrate-binding domain-containing protein [Nakamurella lactea]
MDVHLRDLRYFVAVAEELHFTRASERLYISQPALSKQVSMLERTLGSELFERRRRDVRLTPAGEALLPHARRLIAEWDLATAAVERIRTERRSTLVVGMSTSPGRDGLLSAIHHRFTRQHPDTTLTLRQVSWLDSTAGLAADESDVAFVWLPMPTPSRYVWTVLVEEPCLVAMSDQHPLAARETIAFDELADEPFLALPKSAGPLRDYWLGTAHRHGTEPIVAAEITSPDETYEFLVDGRGMCLIASGNAPSLTRGGVVTRPVTGLPPSRLGLAWRKDRHHPLTASYADCARAAVASAVRSATANTCAAARSVASLYLA